MRGFSAAQRHYENSCDCCGPQARTFDTTRYVDRLISSPTFCEEAIGNAAAEILTAYKAKDHIPHIIDCLIEREAKATMQVALDRASAGREREECEKMVCAYTRYDKGEAA